MRQLFLRAVILLLVGLASGCSKDPKSVAPPDLVVGTVRNALTSNPSPCPAAPNSCDLYPDRDTTVYSVAGKDYGKSHEMCVGLTGLAANGVARALLHFNLGLLPAKSVVMGASLSIHARRPDAATGTLNLYQLLGGFWFEGDGTGLADGHLNTAACPTCTSTGACGWASTGTFNGAGFVNTNSPNVGGSPTQTATYNLTGAQPTVTFGSLGLVVRSQATGSNFGWSIRVADETAQRLVFWSNDTSVGGDTGKPTLNVSYSRGPGSACTFSSDCVFANGSAGVCAGGFCCSGACNDGKSCTTDACNSSGVCSSTPNNGLCNDSNVCTNDTCNPGLGDPTTGCLFTPNSVGCSDGNLCTQTDQCSGGSCVGSNPVVCAPPDQCHTSGSCVPGTGLCSYPNKGNGTGCDDGNSCTTGETCQSGVCTGGVGVTCGPPDQCHNPGVCSGGVCSYAPKTNGTTCNADSDACTVNDTCQAGSCVAGTPVVCPTPDQCHNPGTCSPGTGACSNPAKPNGSGCNDGKACTVSDVCTGGLCGGSPKNCDDGIGCTVDSCSEMAGGCVNNTSACGCTKDADCNDSNPCNGVETCNTSTLTCRSGTPIDCSSLTDQCNTGACSPGTGTCSAAPKADGTGCNDGDACTTSDACKSGACKGTTITCPTPDQCHNPGSCVSGACTNPVKTNGTSCNDGSACTTSDTCQSGTCTGGAALPCSDGNVCTVDGCAPGSGCTFTAGNAGTVCVPASCSGGKETQAAKCTGSSAACPAPVVKDCAPYACGATACRTSCTLDTDCAAGNYCAAGGVCKAKGNPSAVCGAANQCLTGFCADGVCCDDDCVGQCEACNLPSKAGTCSPVTGKPVAPRAACIGDGTGCDGVCNGSLTTACTVPGQSTQCRAPSCDAKTNVSTLAEFCNGSGSCPTPRTQDCTPGVCGQTQCTGCSTNANCPSGDFCRGGVCKPQSGNGVKCSIDAECTSSHCVDGVCCNSDCKGQCEACAQTGFEGQCTAIPADHQPAQGRPGCAGAGTPCGGVCDGTTTRACTYPGPGVSCHAAACKNGVADLQSFCDGGGNCPSLGQETCPKGAKCVGVLCGGVPDSCTSDGDCNRDDYCAGGVCEPKKDAGISCNTAGECRSGICVDGVCCTQACTGQCEACNAPGTEGTCTPIKGSPRGSRQPCATDSTVCGGSCDGLVADRCSYAGLAVACRPGTCAGGLADLAAFCQGNGFCAPLQQQSCDPVGCDTVLPRCAGPCASDAGCPSDQYCSAGMCVPKLPTGMTCGAPSHCTGGNCVDGVCCDTACTGQCQACDQVGHIGTCSPVAGAPRDGRPGCRGAGACGGYCDGTRIDACAMPGPAVKCGVAFCVNGAATQAPVCNSVATCVIPTPDSCDPYQCDPSGPGCLTSCQSDEDCAQGLVCNNGGCAQPTTPPATSDGGVDAGRPDASTTGPDAGTKPGTGGGANAGGNAGTTGAAGGAGKGTGGASSGSGGSGNVDGGVTGPDGGKKPSGGGKGKDEGGCGCRVTGEAQGNGRGLAAALALAALLVARRRRPAPRDAA